MKLLKCAEGGYGVEKMKRKIVIPLLGSLVQPQAHAIEEPQYREETKYKEFVIRSYDSTLVAQTEVDASFEDAGSQAFRVLAGYIFGKNVSKEKIAMTAPVTQSEKTSEKIAMTAPVTQGKSEKGYVVQFTMPAKYTRASLPEPMDARVKIVELPARKVAVYSYSGSWSQENFKEKLDVFRAALSREHIAEAGEPVLARFNSPWQLWFLRRNEIWIEVKTP
ncbi:MAG: hypothetical protein RIR26_290 [Pseudomonadota bacterium]|jgi:uncharacterized membrane protein